MRECESLADCGETQPVNPGAGEWGEGVRWVRRGSYGGVPGLADGAEESVAGTLDGLSSDILLPVAPPDAAVGAGGLGGEEAGPVELRGRRAVRRPRRPRPGGRRQGRCSGPLPEAWYSKRTRVRRTRAYAESRWVGWKSAASLPSRKARIWSRCVSVRCEVSRSSSNDLFAPRFELIPRWRPTPRSGSCAVGQDWRSSSTSWAANFPSCPSPINPRRDR